MEVWFRWSSFWIGWIFFSVPAVHFLRDIFLSKKHVPCRCACTKAFWTLPKTTKVTVLDRGTCRGEPNKTKMIHWIRKKKQSMRCDAFMYLYIFDKYSKLRNKTKKTQKYRKPTQIYVYIYIRIYILRSYVQKWVTRKCRVSNPRIHMIETWKHGFLLRGSEGFQCLISKEYSTYGTHKSRRACAFIPRHRTGVPEVQEFQYWLRPGASEPPRMTPWRIHGTNGIFTDPWIRLIFKGIHVGKYTIFPWILWVLVPGLPHWFSKVGKSSTQKRQTGREYVIVPRRVGWFFEGTQLSITGVTRLPKRPSSL